MNALYTHTRNPINQIRTWRKTQEKHTAHESTHKIRCAVPVMINKPIEDGRCMHIDLKSARALAADA